MDHALHNISYTADIGSVLVLMARRRLARRPASQAHSQRLYKMICHIFHSEDVSIGFLGGLGEKGTQGQHPPPPKPTGPPCYLVSFHLSSALTAVSAIPKTLRHVFWSSP